MDQYCSKPRFACFEQTVIQALDRFQNKHIRKRNTVMARNILGEALECCCMNPLTGFYRNGKCDTAGQDHGLHTVCIHMTDEFLEFAKNQGNDLITPMPQYDFPGLKPGDRWCVCVGTVMQAIEANKPPKIDLKATHSSVLEFISRETLQACAIED